MQQVSRAVFFPNGDVLKLAKCNDCFDVQTLDKQDHIIESHMFINQFDADKSISSVFNF